MSAKICHSSGVEYWWNFGQGYYLVTISIIADRCSTPMPKPYPFHCRSVDVGCLRYLVTIFNMVDNYSQSAIMILDQCIFVAGIFLYFFSEAVFN